MADGSVAPPKSKKKVGRGAKFNIVTNILARNIRLIPEKLQKSSQHFWTICPTFSTYRPPEFDEPIPLIIHENGQVEAIRVQDVARWVVAFGVRNAKYEFDWKTALAVADHWLNTAAPLETKPALVKWAGESGYAWSVLPWERGIRGPTPTWAGFVERLEANREPFKLWIGSLFFEDSDRSQYVWLRGAGDDGKSTIIEVLTEIFGRSADVSRTGLGQWGAWGLLGKRLIAYPDTNNSEFTTSGDFKSWTGDRRIMANRKHKDPVNISIFTKFIFSSQREIQISSDRADKRRCIYCPVGPLKIKDPYAKQKLWDEAGAFLSECIELYETKMQPRVPIPLDKEGTALLDDLASITEVNFDLFARQYLIFGDGFKISANDLVVLWRKHNRNLDNNLFAGLKRYLSNRGVHYKRHEDGRFYEGIKASLIPLDEMPGERLFSV